MPEKYKVETEEYEIDGEVYETVTFSFESVKVTEREEEKNRK